MKDLNTYKLLTPGPLTTTPTVKETMLIDRCTWDSDYNAITQEIRHELLRLAHADNGQYTAVLGKRYFRSRVGFNINSGKR